MIIPKKHPLTELLSKTNPTDSEKVLLFGLVRVSNDPEFQHLESPEEVWDAMVAGHDRLKIQMKMEGVHEDSPSNEGQKQEVLSNLLDMPIRSNLKN